MQLARKEGPGERGISTEALGLAGELTGPDVGDVRPDGFAYLIAQVGVLADEFRSVALV